MSTLAGRTILMSGGSRGIGLAIALRAARDGANVVLLAKTDKPHARLPGTVHTAAEAIEQVGGRARAVVGDVRDDRDVARAVQTAAEELRAFVRDRGLRHDDLGHRILIYCDERDRLYHEVSEHYCRDGCILRTATLEDVFLKLTGRELRE